VSSLKNNYYLQHKVENADETLFFDMPIHTTTNAVSTKTRMVAKPTGYEKLSTKVACVLADGRKMILFIELQREISLWQCIQLQLQRLDDNELTIVWLKELWDT
jgi:hypothetical protein